MAQKLSLFNDWPAIDVGSFRHHIVLLESTVTTDAGGSVQTWQPGIDPIGAWVAVKYVRGEELIKAGQDVDVAIITLTSWWRPEFAPGQKIQLPNGSQYTIQYRQNVSEMSVYMILTCQAFSEDNR